MPIFRYTLKKYMKSKSTWIITFISMILSGLLVGYLPYSFIEVDQAGAARLYQTIVISAIGGVASFLTIFVSIFAGFKAATMYKDEVEDGTFLVMLSKPQSRSRIIFLKWLALQVTIILYTFITIATFVIFTVIFDVGHKIDGLDSLGISTISSYILVVSLILWALLFVASLIFSSISILFSTKLAVGSTIGIAAGLGVVIPLTSLITVFAQKSNYNFMKSSTHGRLLNVVHLNKDLFPSFDEDDFQDFIDFYDQTSEDLSDVEKGILELGVKTGETDAFGALMFLDINYQFTKMSEFAIDAIPVDETLANLGDADNRADGGSIPVSITRASGDILQDAAKSSFLEAETLLGKMVGNSITKVQNLALELVNHFIIGQPVPPEGYSEFQHLILAMAQQPLSYLLSADTLVGAASDNGLASVSYNPALVVDEDGNQVLIIDAQEILIYETILGLANDDKGLVAMINAKEYVSKNTILIIYISLALILIPISYFIVRRQDFR